MPVGFPFTTQEIKIPEALGWPSDQYPLAIIKSGRAVSCDFIPEAYAASALGGTVYFVDGVNGNNTNSGLGSYANAKKSIYSAVAAGNAAGLPYTVMIKAGTYVRADQFSDSGGATKPTQNVAFIADGGRVKVGPFDTLTWALDGTYTNCYKATRVNTVRVYDIANTDLNGDYVELSFAESASACNSTENSWYTDGTTVYVNRSDNAVVSNTNTRAYLLVDNFVTSTGTKSVYFGSNTATGGFDFEGGQAGCFADYAGHAGEIIAVNCTFKYSGSAVNLFDCVRVDNLDGLAAFVNCTANSGAKDGFNFHNTGGGGSYYALTINCTAKNNGRFTSQSNNAHTGHDNVVAIDINGNYDFNYGGTIVWIGSSKIFCAGTSCYRSQGDTSLGGGITPVEYNVYNSAKMWLDTCTAKPSGPSGKSAEATSSSALYVRNCNFAWGSVTGNIFTY